MADPGSTLHLIRIDGTHYVAVAISHSAEDAPELDLGRLPLEALPSEPHTAFLINEYGQVVEGAKKVRSRMVEAVNRKARAAIELLVVSEEAFHEANLVYGSIEDLLYAVPPYIPAVFQSYDLGDGVRVRLYVLASGAEYSASVLAGPASAGYRLYQADQSGVIVETNSEEHPFE